MRDGIGDSRGCPDVHSSQREMIEAQVIDDR
jgi:hypothetical protein